MAAEIHAVQKAVNDAVMSMHAPFSSARKKPRMSEPATHPVQMHMQRRRRVVTLL
jgi:hypothetical protein